MSLTCSLYHSLEPCHQPQHRPRVAHLEAKRFLSLPPSLPPPVQHPSSSSSIRCLCHPVKIRKPRRANCTVVRERVRSVAANVKEALEGTKDLAAPRSLMANTTHCLAMCLSSKPQDCRRGFPVLIFKIRLNVCHFESRVMTILNVKESLTPERVDKRVLYTFPFVIILVCLSFDIPIF